MSRRALVAGALVLGAACHGRADKAGEAVAKRVVSLSPSTTETMFAMGASDAIVGRSRYCDFPKEALALPEVGGYVDPNLEAVLALRPDLVTGARGPAGQDVADRFGARGIATYFPDTESFAAIDAMVRGLGARTGHAGAAEATVASMHAREEEVEHAVAALPRVRTLLVFGLAPIVAAGPQGFPAEMLARAGGENVVLQGGKYPTMGVEHVMALDPDIIVDAAIGEGGGVERIGLNAPGWRETRAVKTGHVVTLTDEVVLRPGPRVGEGLAVLARALHPEAFGGHGG